MSADHTIAYGSQAGPEGRFSHSGHCSCGWGRAASTRPQLDEYVAEHLAETAATPSPSAAVPVATATGKAVVPAAPAAVAGWSADQAELIRQHLAPGSSDAELAYFAQVCRHKQLDPFAGEICVVPVWDPKTRRTRPDIRVTVAGLRVIADRSGQYAGQDPPRWCGPDGRWVDVWLASEPPAAAWAAVRRTGWADPVVGVARYASHVQLDKDGKPRGPWATGPDFMLAKCAEAAALRRAFPTQMTAAGITGPELSVASRMSMEARRAGLDDQARHELVAEVTGGRTDSTRDMTDAEAVMFRSTVARMHAEAEAVTADGWEPIDPDTGEILDAEPDNPEPAEPVTDDELERRRLISDLFPRIRALPTATRAEFENFLGRARIDGTRPTSAYTLSELRAVAGWVDTLDRSLEEPF